MDPNIDHEIESWLYQRYLPVIKKYLSRFTADRMHVEDAAQEAFIVLLVKLRKGEISDLESLDAYARNVAKKVWAGRVRRADVNRLVYYDVVPDVEAQEQRAAIVDRAFRRAFLDLQKLNPVTRDRDLLVRYFVYDQSKQEICRELELSGRHFDRVLHRARNRMKKLIRGKADSQRSTHREYIASFCAAG